MTALTRIVTTALITFTGVLALAVVLSACSSMNQQWHRDCAVIDKDRILDQGSSGEKRVITSCGTFTASDSIAGGFESYDTWNGLAKGKRYDIRTGGYRVGLLSTFPNIIEYREVVR